MKTNQSKTLKLSVLCGLLISLSACNGGSGNNTAATTPNADTALSAESADLDLQTSSFELADHILNQIESNEDSIKFNGSMDVAALEKSYEQSFCQLTDKASNKDSLDNKKACQANIKFIREQPKTGFFNLADQPILNNKAYVESVIHESVSYSTIVDLPNGQKTTFKVSGGLLLPQGNDKNAGDIPLKGVIVYFHGTTFNKAMVGSNKDNPETKLAAEVFASQGYVVLIPDYIGQGEDYHHVHPYVLFPEISVKTALDMLSAVKPEIQQKYGLNDKDQLKLFTGGYSEGGAYSLWFNSYVSKDNSSLDSFYKLTHSVGMEGAYDTSKVTKGFLFSNVEVSKKSNFYQSQQQVVTNLAKPILSADALVSYAAYATNWDFAGVLSDPFLKMNCPGKQSLCNVGKNHISLVNAFNLPDTSIALPILVSALGKTSNGYTYASNLLTSSNNNVNALVNPKFLTADSQAKLDLVLKKADVNLDNAQAGTVSIITLDQDSMVTPNNYDALLSKYPNKFKETIKIDHSQIKVVDKQIIDNQYSSKAVLANVDHLHALNYEFLYALDIFNSYTK